MTGRPAERGFGEDDAEALYLHAAPARAAGRGEHVRRLQPLLHGGVDERACEVHALDHAALLGPVVQARLHAPLADERQVEARELRSQAGQTPR